MGPQHGQSGRLNLLPDALLLDTLLSGTLLSINNIQPSACSRSAASVYRGHLNVFATSDEFEDQLASMLAGGKRCWTGAWLTTPAPWFLVTYTSSHQKAPCSETMLIAWESILLSLLERLQQRVLWVGRVSQPISAPGTWALEGAAELWAVSETESKKTGPLLFRFQAELVDSFGREVNDSREDRRLLFSRSHL